jgi:hypothetical protein
LFKSFIKSVLLNDFRRRDEFIFNLISLFSGTVVEAERVRRKRDVLSTLSSLLPEELFFNEKRKRERRRLDFCFIV